MMISAVQPFQKKRKSQVLHARFPEYAFLPWELESAKEYAHSSANHFSTLITDSRDSDKKENDALIGDLGEVGFLNMLDEKFKLKIKEWPRDESKFSSKYDFLAADGSTFDIKTTIESDRVPNPESCNFVVGFAQFNAKRKKHIDYCDYYIQMFLTKDLSKVYFIGAISIDEIQKYYDDRHPDHKEWYKRTQWCGVIHQSKMDFTDKFRSYFNDFANIDYGAQEEAQTVDKITK